MISDTETLATDVTQDSGASRGMVKLERESNF